LCSNNNEQTYLGATLGYHNFHKKPFFRDEAKFVVWWVLLQIKWSHYECDCSAQNFKGFCFVCSPFVPGNQNPVAPWPLGDPALNFSTAPSMWSMSLCSVQSSPVSRFHPGSQKVRLQAIPSTCPLYLCHLQAATAAWILNIGQPRRRPPFGEMQAQKISSSVLHSAAMFGSYMYT